VSPKMKLKDLLFQGEVWQTKEGQVIPIPEMGPSHIRNTLAMLRRRAFQIVIHVDLSTREPNGDMAAVGLEQEMEEACADPSAWLDSQPLMVALIAQQAEWTRVLEVTP
jgi:hypothetical protein